MFLSFILMNMENFCKGKVQGARGVYRLLIPFESLA